jgi:hypothetical protein
MKDAADENATDQGGSIKTRCGSTCSSSMQEQDLLSADANDPPMGAHRVGASIIFVGRW